MDDLEFSELQLQATIIPQQARWPAPEYVHCQLLHAAANEMRDRVKVAFNAMDEIDHNADPSREGKERQRRKVAAQAIAEFGSSKALTRAREALERVELAREDGAQH